MAWGTELVGTIVSYAARVGTTGIDLTPHASTLTGDLMIAFIVAFETDYSHSPPSGWTALVEDKDNLGSPDRSTLVYAKYATTDAPGATTFTTGNTYDDQMAGVIITIPGGDPSTMLDVTYAVGTHQAAYTNKASPNVDAHQPITTATDGAKVILFEYITHDDITSEVAPSGYSLIAANTGSAEDHRQFFIFSKDVATAGAETPGAAAYTSNNTVADCTMITLAFKPAAGGGGSGDLQLKVGGSWKTGVECWLNVGGTWKLCEVWLKVGGTWKQVT